MAAAILALFATDILIHRAFPIDSHAKDRILCITILPRFMFD